MSEAPYNEARRGRLIKTALVGRRVTLPPLGEEITQADLATLLLRQDSEVRRWLGRREATRRVEGGPGPHGPNPRRVWYLVDEVLVDAVEEWGYVVVQPQEVTA